MNITVTPGVLRGTVERVMTSKSQAHRLLICAGLAEEETRLRDVPASEDAEATIRCLRAMGAQIRGEAGDLTVRGGAVPAGETELDCGESGSTLRFMLPQAAARGLRASFTGRGKLASRPLSPLYEEMERHGIEMSPQGAFPLLVRGRLSPGEYRLAGDVSSQFISGLLMALPLLEGDSRVEILGRLESRPYVDLTLDTLGTFGIRTEETETGFRIPGGQTFRSPGEARVEGDWSGAAFWLAAGALSREGVTCRNLNLRSAQGDRAMVTLLKGFGAEVTEGSDAVTVRRGVMRGIDIDAADIPDLVPILAVTAAYAEGDTRIRHIRRLRIKESDRVASVLALIRSLGGAAEAGEDVMTIRGSGRLRGGAVDAFRDHRIAMAAAIAGTGAEQPVSIEGAEAVNKSYPGFFEEMKALEGGVRE